jgi:hypothetical protein
MPVPKSGSTSRHTDDDTTSSSDNGDNEADSDEDYQPP